MIGIFCTHGGTVPAGVRAACVASINAAGFRAVVSVLPDADTPHPDSAYIHSMPCAQPGLRDRWARILEGLNAARDLVPPGPQLVALLEHDVIYPPGYALLPRQTAPGQVNYTEAVRLTRTGWARARALSSTAVGRIGDLSKIALKRINSLDTGMRIKWDEPGRNPGDGIKTLLEVFADTPPTVDVRHGHNLTGDRRPNLPANMRYLGDYRDYWTTLNNTTGATQP